MINALLAIVFLLSRERTVIERWAFRKLISRSDKTELWEYAHKQKGNRPGLYLTVIRRLLELSDKYIELHQVWMDLKVESGLAKIVLKKLVQIAPHHNALSHLLSRSDIDPESTVMIHEKMRRFLGPLSPTTP